MPGWTLVHSLRLVAGFACTSKARLISPFQRKDPFGKQLNSTETKDLAQKYSQDFTDLRRQLEEFKGTFDSFAHDREVKLGDDIIAKNNSIKTLQLEIAAYVIGYIYRRIVLTPPRTDARPW